MSTNPAKSEPKNLHDALLLFLKAGFQVNPQAYRLLSKHENVVELSRIIIDKIKTMKVKPLVITEELIRSIIWQTESLFPSVSARSRPTGATQQLVDYIFESPEEKKRFLEASRLSKRVIRGDIPVSESFQGDLLLVLSDEQTALTHGLHKFPAKFIPEIPRWPIMKYSNENEIVLDPFVGSGGTMIEARLHRRNSYGIDVHPLAQLIAKVAVTPLDANRLMKTRDWLLSEIYADEKSNVQIPDFPNRDYWFEERVSEDLAIITKHINRIDDEDIREFFLVCLSSIIRQASRADPKFLYALAISKKMRKINKQRRVHAFQLFKERLSEQIPKMIEFSRRSCKDYFARVIGRDARNIELEDGSVDLVVTSPPYLNAVDYPRAHQLEMYWLGLWKGPLADLKKIYIGTEQVTSPEYADLRQYGNPRLDALLRQIYLKDKRRSAIVCKYFLDMKKNFQEVSRVLKHGRHYVVVVGDNVIRQIAVPTHEILMDVAREVGFSVEEYFGSVIVRRPHDMRQEEKIEADWVMVFRKEV